MNESQRKLIKAFKANSADQVTGFYLEEFGMFSQACLYQEFNLNPQGAAAFGLKKEHLDAIFTSLISNGWIENRTPQDFHYSVTAKKGNPFHLNQLEDLFAVIAHLPLSPEGRIEVANRLHHFLFQAAQASFSFSWKTKSIELEAKTLLLKEEESHKTEILEAHHFLQNHLATEGLSLTEFKRNVLLNNSHGVTSAARNALIRYLVHRTELQHITNALKAPLRGERNQIELLSTPRRYSIDLLFQQATTA